MKQSDRLLFLKYAVPCATTLVQRNSISRPEYESLVESVKRGAVPRGEPEKMFKVAYAFCKAAALGSHRGIDARVIREYFWFGHDAAVQERFELMRDFDPVQCRTYPGVVTRATGPKAIVRTSEGEMECSAEFARGIREGSYVVVHRGFVAEEVPKETAVEIAERTGKRFMAPSPIGPRGVE